MRKMHQWIENCSILLKQSCTSYRFSLNGFLPSKSFELFFFYMIKPTFCCRMIIYKVTTIQGYQTEISLRASLIFSYHPEGQEMYIPGLLCLHYEKEKRFVRY